MNNGITLMRHRMEMMFPVRLKDAAVVPMVLFYYLSRRVCSGDGRRYGASGGKGQDGAVDEDRETGIGYVAGSGVDVILFRALR